MKIAIIGAGNMGGSIARGLAKGSLIDDSDIIVSNPSAGKLEKLKKEFPGISITNSNVEAATGAEIYHTGSYIQKRNTADLYQKQQFWGSEKGWYWTVSYHKGRCRLSRNRSCFGRAGNCGL